MSGPSNVNPQTADNNDVVQLLDSGEDDVENGDDGNDGDASEDDTEESESDDEDDEDGSGEESDDSITSERLNALLDKARERQRQRLAEKAALQEDVIKVSDDRPLPKIDAGTLAPKPYFTTPTSKTDAPKLVADPGAERLSKATQKRKADIEPERLSKKQKRELREKTAGPGWFDMPSPSGTELAKIKREMEAARLAAALDPKTFLRKEAMKQDVPKYIQLGKIVETKSPFERASRKNLTKAEKKKSIVDELVEDAEARAYAKRKFLDLQHVRGEKGRLTNRRRQEMKAARRKW
ncbi:Fcf2-domain-containing protein [Dacryopinax primogenitus]|uniref:Fcf2-domain-containing protein n=1 Tax=Dacryopinax primogenitus (strain DJM 731) TaxID=1858805 RepID=M5G4N9_DACPD|nr:Fcf2-domain-containing protein [Dacryopinax primogenitus]EJT98697.1 Fcf2-domain-containing protein [Dacryopinax primogenitus]